MKTPNHMNHIEPHPDLYGIPARTTDYNGMPYRNLGSSGLKVSNIGLGTWKFGFPETGDGSRIDEQTAFGILDKAVSLGVTFWDTANRYNNASGNSERILGRWFQRNGSQRRNVVLATKISGCMDGITPNHWGLSRGNILDSVQASMERLQTDSIDVLYFHLPDPDTPPEESLSAIEDIVRQGLVRYFAISNMTVEQIKVYQQLESAFSVRCRIVAVQNKFDILHGESPKHPGVLAHVAQTGPSFVAWGPLARGFLSSRYLDISNVGKGDRLFDEGILNDVTEDDIKKIHLLNELAVAWNMELSQLALAYTLTLPGMGPVIPSSSSIPQLENNAAAGTIDLSQEQREQIRTVLEGKSE
jgi:aryl-alcohol dehydrogenase-like predicted oxidoreductase